MKIYVIGDRLEKDIEDKFDLEYVSFDFDDYKIGDILILNEKYNPFSSRSKKIENIAHKKEIIVINLSNRKLKLDCNYYFNVPNLILLLDSIIKDNYFESNGVPIRYKYIDKGYDKTLVVLQSSGIKWTDREKYDEYVSGKISELDYSMFVSECHRKYVFFKSFEDVEYNLLFVQDNYNNGFGWYLLHNNKKVDYDIAMGIDYLLEKNNQDKEESVIFGSSKGAYGAIILGQHLKTKVLCQYPIYDVIRRYNLNKTDDYKVQYENLKKKNNIILGKEKNIFKITINEALKTCSGRLTILAGIADDDTSVLLGKVTVFKTDIKLFINTKLMTHGQYAANSKGQISAILNNEDVSKFSIKEWEVEFKN